MKNTIASILFACALVSFTRAAESAAGSQSWIAATPEEVGMDSGPLVEMFEHVRARKIPVHSVQIVRKGRFALDAYFFPYDGRSRHDVASVTKSVTSILVGLAMDRGRIRDVNQPVLDFFPSSQSKTSKPRQTIENLLTMQSGWDCGLEPNEARLFEMRRSADWIRFMLELPEVTPPGTRWAYCSGNCHVLSAILTRATGTNALAFARRHLFEPLDIRDSYWTADPEGNNHGWGDLQLHPRDMAKLGQLFLLRGRWRDQQIISENWVKRSTQPHAAKTINQDRYGYYWWIKGKEYPGMFEAVGRGGQRISVWPEKELVVVFTGGGFEPGDIAGFIIRALKSDQSLPPNPEGNVRLRSSLAAALKPPQPHATPELPPMAARVSGRTFTLATNQLAFSALTLQFNKSPEAFIQIQRLGEALSSAAGLDGVERFSNSKLVDLPFACKGQWLSDRVFLLELDRVAGISLYQFRIEFTEDSNSMTIELKERSGLSAEIFRGTASR